MNRHHPITLRPAIFEDHMEVAKLHTKNWRENYRGIMSDDYLDREIEDDRLSTWFNKMKNVTNGQVITIAEMDNKLIGFCCLTIDEHPVFGSYIDNLHVSGEWQGQGIGRLMLSHAAHSIRQKAKTGKMYLWVYEANNNARKAYEKMGAINFETVDLLNEDNTIAPNCRYIWNDMDILIDTQQQP